MTSIYAQRRARLAAQLGAGGIAILPTAPERPRNRDSDYLYRHDSYFYYLTGFSEPNAWLVLTADGRSLLFCQPKDLEREIWDGIRLGPEAAPAALGVDEAFSVEELHQRLPQLLENRTTVWWPFATHTGLEGRIDEGSSTMPGGKAGQVVSGGAVRVRAWALEPDRRHLRNGQAVQLAFDAYPGRSLPGRIAAIAGAPERKPEWGDGRYFTVDIDLLRQGRLTLLPGMSVRVTAPMAQGATR